MKINNKTKLRIITIVFFIMMFGIFLLYTRFYYGSLGYGNLLVHFIVCCNMAFSFINDLYSVILKAIVTENNVKVLIIGIIAIYILNKIDLNNIITNMSKFEFGQLKIERQLEVLKEISEVEEDNHKKLITDSIDHEEINEDIRKKVQASERKLEIIKLLMEEPYLLELFMKFVEGKIKAKTIPYNILKCKTSTDSVDKLFECKYRDNSVRLLGLKNDIKEIAAKLYVDEVSKR